jgi:hypothetical protein
VNPLPLIGLGLVAGAVAVAALGARLIAREALALSESMRQVRALQPALVELRDEADEARAVLLRLRSGARLQ